jgi:FAD/FMN-containing dehydrogenase
MVDRRVISTTGTVLDEATIQEFKVSLRGELIRPGDEVYDTARKIWNGMIDKHPALIARCTGVADVISAVNFARTNEILVAVRGGGHGVAGTAVCDGGIVIDLSKMKGMRVDPTTHTARAQAGLVWGDFNHETQAFGLATTGGFISTTGIAGLTLGGGVGWLMRKYGLTCDNLLSVDVVTADGQLLTASKTENADLFWGLRGGGGNFGIATSFEYQLHPVGPMILAGMVFHPATKAKEVLKFYQEYAATVPDELGSMVFLRTAPKAPFLPEHVHGTPVVAIGVCYAGPIDEGERVVQPLRDFGPPLADTIGPMSYKAFQMMFDSNVPPGLLVYWKSGYLANLGDEAIDAIIAHAWSIRSPLSITILGHLGGALSRVGVDETSFGDRYGKYATMINAMWTDPQESDEHIRWAREFFASTEPFSTGGVYVNFLGNEGEKRVKAAYGQANYERLVTLKNKYDPTNFFSLNQNIKPRT